MKSMPRTITWIALPCLAIAPIAIALTSVERWSASFASPEQSSSLAVISPAATASPVVPSPDPFPGIDGTQTNSTADIQSNNHTSVNNLSHSTNPVNSTSNTPDTSPNPIAQGFNCDDPQSQQDMNYCSYLDYQEADDALNRTYNQLMETLSPTRQEKLITAEQAWIAYRDATCEFERSRYEGGSIEPLIYNSCLAQLTQEQTQRLEGYFQDY